MQFDLCCIGHITLDMIITGTTTTHLPGGTAYYFSQALSRLEVAYLLVTAVAESETELVRALEQKGIPVKCWPSRQTVFFENRYGANPDHRTQRVLQQADPFEAGQVREAEAGIYHLGPLLAHDISPDLIKILAAQARVSLDVQGFLRRVENETVIPVDWEDKERLLPLIHYLKVNEQEMEVLTGHQDVYQGARTLYDQGVKEVIITLGSRGSLIYSEGSGYAIPAFQPERVADATGCGDTYMAGYLYQRIKGAGIQKAGEFAAAMATLKMESSGPFTGSLEEVDAVLKHRERWVLDL